MEQLQDGDPTWRLWARSREQYDDLFVKPGRFHTSVPEDVVHAYKRAEHLMRQAWHHYPSYDDALAKLTLIVEIAVKLRCDQLGIVRYRVNAKGKQIDFTLSELMNKLSAHEPAKKLKFVFSWARHLRNMFAHPSDNGFAGIALAHTVRPFVNLYNRIFLDEQVAVADDQQLAELSKTFASFADCLSALEWNGQRILVKRAVPMGAHQVADGWLSFWDFQLVFDNAYQVLSAHSYYKEPTIGLLNATSRGGALEGTDILTGELVRLQQTDHPTNLAKFANYQAELGRVTEEDLRIFNGFRSSNVLQAYHFFQYKHYWSS